jgi:hypothetical protein
VIETAARLWTMVTAELSGVELPNDTPKPIADNYGIEKLHDTDSPNTTEQEDNLAWDYVRSSVSSLMTLVGERYGLVRE